MANPNIIKGHRNIKFDVRFYNDVGAQYPDMIKAFKDRQVTVKYGKKYPIGYTFKVKDIDYYVNDVYGGVFSIYFISEKNEKILSYNCIWDFDHYGIMKENQKLRGEY